MEKKKTDKLNYLIAVLFVVYMALLVWIILFKLQFSISELDTIRGINLIPFYYDNEVNGGDSYEKAKFSYRKKAKSSPLCYPASLFYNRIDYNHAASICFFALSQSRCGMAVLESRCNLHSLSYCWFVMYFLLLLEKTMGLFE